MRNIYNAIKNNKLLTVGTVGVGLTLGSLPFIKPDYESLRNNPSYIENYVEVDKTIRDIKDTQVTIGDLLDPSFKQAYEETINELEAKRDSLKALPNFERDMKTLEANVVKIREQQQKHDRNGIAYLISTLGFSIPFSVGLVKVLNRKRERKYQESKHQRE